MQLLRDEQGRAAALGKGEAWDTVPQDDAKLRAVLRRQSAEPSDQQR